MSGVGTHGLGISLELDPSAPLTSMLYVNYCGTSTCRLVAHKPRFGDGIMRHVDHTGKIKVQVLTFVAVSLFRLLALAHGK